MIIAQLLTALSYSTQGDEMRIMDARLAYAVKIDPSIAADKENT